MAQQFEFGLDTFGDITSASDGKLLPQAQVIRDVIEEAVLADELGVDAFGVGEHHRSDFAVSAPEVVLAAIAGRTKRIRLGSAVTVLSTDDPIRVFERFSTLNAASNGRAEVTLGRGSFTESFPLFGYDLSQYEELFEEKLDLFAALLRQEAVTWRGNLRPPLDQPACVSADRKRAAQDLDRRRRQPGIGRARRALRPAAGACHHRRRSASGFGLLSISITAPTRSSASPRARSQSIRRGTSRRPTKRRARSIGPTTRACTTASAPSAAGRRSSAPNSIREVERGSLYVGAPETVARKIAATAKALGIVRFDMKYSAGTLAHEKLMRCIELYGSKVIPLVREMLGLTFVGDAWRAQRGSKEGRTDPFGSRIT